MGYWLVMAAAGSGARYGEKTPKQYLPLAGRRVIDWSLAPFLADRDCLGIALVAARGDECAAELCRVNPALRLVAGGARRCDSVLAGLESLATRAAADDFALVHDAARPCLAAADLAALLSAGAGAADGALLAEPVRDTLKRAVGDGPPLLSAATEARHALWRAQTPQMFRLHALLGALRAALRSGREPTDESQVMEWQGARPQLVPAQSPNPKITTAPDLQWAEAILRAKRSGVDIRIGSGIDVHAFGAGDHVMLGGVRVPHSAGVVAHSDGDVLLHALVDALLGAAGLGDIGQHFPDHDPRWRGAASGQFVTAALGLLNEHGLQAMNADLTLLAEAPRLGPVREAIRANVAALLQVPAARVNVKATTTEGLGFLGRGEGLAAMATVSIAARSEKDA